MVRTPKIQPTQTTTDFSFAERYIEERKYGKYVPIKVNFPYIDDRKAANIDFAAEENRRSFRGRPLLVQDPLSKLTVKGYKDLSSSEFLFINKARNGSNVPQGFVGTSSGIEPLTYVPFTQGPPSSTVVEVNQEFDNSLESGDIFVAKNLEKLEESASYIPVDSGAYGVGRFNWNINPDFDNPTFPNLRFPLGARKKTFFRNS